jgi:hypothetical protein
MKRRHASPALFSPVSAQIPRASISPTTAASAAFVSVFTQRSERTETTRPGYGPGMPGTAAAR